MPTLDWHELEARQRLFESRYHRAFFNLAHHFQPQIKPTFCGIATAVIFLNAFRCRKGLSLNQALNVPRPGCPDGSAMEYNAYSQLTFFNELTQTVKPAEMVEGRAATLEEFDPGLSLDDWVAKMRLYLLDVERIRADSLGKERERGFRNDLKSFLNDPEIYLGVNYFGRSLGKDVGGHFSPVVAYHEASDSCMVMDVAGHKHPWFWVELPLLWQAMHTKDGDNYRGYVRVRDKLAL